MVCCRKRHFWLVLLAALPVFLASEALSQTTSRPASILLSATLEDLSVRTVNTSETPVLFANIARGVTFTSSWALAAHTTTVRLFTSFVSEPTDTHPASEYAVKIPARADPVPASAAASMHLMQSGEVNVFAQPAGLTNRPVKRTDSIDLERTWSSRAQSATGETTGTVMIRVQAL